MEEFVKTVNNTEKTGRVGTELTGYPSIDKPWLKYLENKITDLDIPQCDVFEYLKKSSQQFGKDVAIEYLSCRISYNKLFEKIDEAARALKAVGVQEGEIVSVCLPNIPEVVYLIYAINRIGAVANLLDVRAGETALKTALIDSKSEVLICLDLVCDKVSAILQDTNVRIAVAVSALDSLPSVVGLFIKLTRRNLNPKVSTSFISWRKFVELGRSYNGIIDAIYKENANAYIAYTGGTTGIPKGVIATNENIIAQCKMQALFGHNVGKGDRSLSLAPPWTYYGLCNSINNCLCVGMTLLLIPKIDNKELGATIVRTKASYIVTVPMTLFSIMEDRSLKDANLSFVNALIVGADKLDESLEIRMNEFLEAHGCKNHVQKGYGMTEVMAAAACTKKGVDAIGSVGIPCPGVTISAFAEANGIYSECRAGEKGEIAIQAPTIMRGYFGYAEKETCDVLKQHEDGLVWAHTGDVGYVGEDGRIYIVGRIKRMFTRNGYKIFPATVENCISNHNAVEQAAVVSVKDEKNGNLTKAFVVKKHFADIDNDTLKTELSKLTADDLYEYEIPDIYEFVDSLPITGMGKIDYRALEGSNRDYFFMEETKNVD